MLATATCVVAWFAYVFLPFSPERLPFTFGCLVIGVVLLGLIHPVVARLPDRQSTRIALRFGLGLLVAAPVLSVSVPRITYSRFGFTVYGALPIPALDITVNRHGVLWFRAKTHQITREEIDGLLSPEVEVVIVGIGWESVAQLTDEAKDLSNSVDLRVLPTPAAFALYNQLKAEGRRVVLLAHTTC